MNSEIHELSITELDRVSGGGECQDEPIHIWGGDLQWDKCSKTMTFIPTPAPKQT